MKEATGKQSRFLNSGEGGSLDLFEEVGWEGVLEEEVEVAELE